MAVLNAQILSQQAALLARGGSGAEGAGRFLLRASRCGRQARADALRAGVVTAILPYLRPTTPTHLLLLLTRTFCNYCRHEESEPPVELELVSPALPLIKDLLDCEDQHVLEAVCSAVTNITHGGEERARAAQAVPGLAPRLDALLAHDAPSVKVAALLAFGNILAAGSTQVETCLGHITSFLRDGPPELARGAAHAVGNLLTDRTAIEPALKAGVLPLLCHLLQQQDSECRDKATRALANLCYFGVLYQGNYAMRWNVLESYYKALAEADGAPPTLQLLAELNALQQIAERDESKTFSYDGRLDETLCSILHNLRFLDLTESLLNRNDKEVQSQAQQLHTAIIFFARNKDIIYEDGQVFTVADIAEGLRAPALGLRISAARAARRMLCRHGMRPTGFFPSHTKHISGLLLAHGVVEGLVTVLDTDNCPDIRYEAAGALRIFFKLQDGGSISTIAIPKLVALLGEGGEAAAHAARALAYLCSNKPETKTTNNNKKPRTKSQEQTRQEAMCAGGVTAAMQPHLSYDAPRELLGACLTLCKALTKNMQPDEAKMFAPALPALLDLMKNSNDLGQTYVSDTLEVMCHVMSSNEGREAAVAVPGMIAQLVAELNGKYWEESLLALGRLLEGNNAQKEQYIDAGCLEYIAQAFDYVYEEKVTIFHSSSCIISVDAVKHLFGGTPAQIQRALDAGLLDLLLRQLHHTYYWGLLGAAGFNAISNLCSKGTTAQRDRFVSAGGLHIWADVLRAGESTSAQYVLSAMRTLFKAAVESKQVEPLRSQLKELGFRDLLQSNFPEALSDFGCERSFTIPATSNGCPEKVLTQQATLLARGGAEAERAAVFLLRASQAGREERAAALRAAALSAVLPYLRPCTPTKLLVPLAQSFSNYCHYVEPEQPVELELVSPALPLIADLLGCKDQNVLDAACAIVANITHGGSERADAARAVPGLVARLEALLAHDALSVKQVALTALGNLLAGGHVEAEGCVGRVAVFLRDGPPALARGAARAAGNMLADPATIQPALDAGVLPLLCKLLEEGSEGKEEAARALANLCRFGSDEQRALVFDMDVLEPCCAALAAAAGAPPTLQLLAGLNELMDEARFHRGTRCTRPHREIQSEDWPTCLASPWMDSRLKLQNRDAVKLLCSRLHKLGILDLIDQLLKHDDKDVQSRALQLQTDVVFYMRGENIVYGDGRVYTVADIADELQSSERGRRLRAASAVQRMMCRARTDHNNKKVVTLQRAPRFNRVKEVRDLMESHAVLERLTADLDTDDCPDLQYEVAEAFRSVFKLHKRFDSTFINSVFRKLVVLADKQGKVATVAIHALSLLPRDVYSTRLKENTEWDIRILRTLLPYLRNDTPSDLLTSCLKIFYTLSLYPDIVDELASALPRIVDLLTIKDHAYYWRILRNMIIESGKGREAVLAMTVRVVALMAHEALEVRRGALDTLMCLLKGSLTQRERCLNEGCLQQIVRILGSDKKLVPTAAETAELVLRGPRAHVRRAVDAGILEPLLNLLSFKKFCGFDDIWLKCGDVKLTGKLNAAKATRNLCQNGSAPDRDQFVKQGGLEAWADLLKKHSETTEFVMSGLDALNQAAREGDVNTEALRSRMKALGYRKLLTELRSRDDIDWSAMNDNERDLFKRYSALL